MSAGQYYYFFNEDGAKNEHGFSYSHGLPFIIDLEKYYFTHQIKIFREVMFNNDWDNCLIYACGDEGQFFYFNPRNNTILRDKHYPEYDNSDSESDMDDNTNTNTNPNKPIDKSDENLYYKKKIKKPIKIN